jgi:hypothetical protein
MVQSVDDRMFQHSIISLEMKIRKDLQELKAGTLTSSEKSKNVLYIWSHLN